MTSSRPALPVLALSLTLGACASMGPQAKGEYETEALDLPARVPVAVRDIAIESARVDTNGDFTFETKEVEEPARVEREIRESVKKDLAAGGPFLPGTEPEATYVLDAKFHSLVISNDVASTVGVNVIKALIGGIFSAAAPSDVYVMKGSGTFTIFASDGTTPIYRRTFEAKKVYPMSVYYNQTRNVGEIAGMLVRIMKKDVSRVADQILAKSPAGQTPAVESAVSLR